MALTIRGLERGVVDRCWEAGAILGDGMNGSGFMVNGSRLVSMENKKAKSGSGFKVHVKAKKTVSYKPKRGKLAPLMTEDKKVNAGIHELSYDFACRITRLFQYLTEDAEYKEYVQSKQLYRSGTSIGANVRESRHAQSDADFLSKMSIAYKEADESDYWLNLLHDNGYLNDEQFDSLNHDMERIIKILTSIVKTMNQKVHPDS